MSGVGWPVRRSSDRVVAPRQFEKWVSVGLSLRFCSRFVLAAFKCSVLE